jgi:AcrR family transcriptional regulator
MTNPMEPWMEELLNSSSGANMTEKQTRIFEAAIEVFAQKGYSASSTSEIASKAGVAEGTIFRHYKTKKDLLLSIVAPAMVRLIAPFVLREFRDVLKTDFDTMDQFLKVIIENRIEFLEKNKSLIRILLQELPLHQDLQEHFHKIVFLQIKERIEKVVERFKDKGQLINLPSPTLIRLIISTVMGYVLIRTFYGMREDAEWDDVQERQATINFIMKGLAPDR